MFRSSIVGRLWAVALVGFGSATGGCGSPPPAPLEPARILEELRRVGLPEDLREGPDTRSGGAKDFDFADGLTLEEACAVALCLHPELRAVRKRLGIAEAEVVIAGLFPDPAVGFDLADLGVLAAEKDDRGSVDSVDLSSGPLDWVAGIDLAFPLPRPGELEAREGAAKASLDTARAMVARAEWQVTGDVRREFLKLLAAKERLRLVERLSALSDRTYEFFHRSREMGAATAFEETLAAIEAEELRRRREGLLLELETVRQRLNARIGLPPETRFDVQGELDTIRPFDGTDVAELVDAALERRPDVAALRAEYLRAEHELRLEISRRWPGVTVGTSVSLELPVFSRMNEPAIRLALRRRDQLRQEFRAAIHAMRAEVHAAVLDWERWHRQVEFFRVNTEPRLTQAIELTDQAFRVREVNLLEVLAAQRNVLDARQEYLELRISEALAADRIRFAAAQDQARFELEAPEVIPEETP